MIGVIGDYTKYGRPDRPPRVVSVMAISPIDHLVL